MEKGKNKAIWVISTLALIFLLGYLTGTKWGCGKAKAPTVLYDTLYFGNPKYEVKEVFIHDTVKHYIPVNPQPQTDYKEEKDDPEVVIQTVKDTVYITKKDEVIQAYHKRFLSGYPQNPKLIRSRFAKNLISHDFLMPTTGRVRSQNYPVDLEHYSYTWEMGDLKATPIPYNPIKQRVQFESYTTMTYDPFQKSGRLVVDGTIFKGKFGITLQGVLNGVEPHGEFRFGLRFKNTK